MFRETKTRSFLKVCAWRVIAVFNAYLILVIFPTSENMTLSLLMNGTGFVLLYFFERIINKIQWGKVLYEIPVNEK